MIFKSEASKLVLFSAHTSPYFLALKNLKVRMLDSGGLEHTKSRVEMLFVRVDAVCRHPSGLAFDHKAPFAYARLPKEGRSSIGQGPPVAGRQGPVQL